MLSEALLTEQHGPAERGTVHTAGPRAGFMGAELPFPHSVLALQLLLLLFYSLLLT